jgi:hypothetical protein
MCMWNQWYIVTVTKDIRYVYSIHIIHIIIIIINIIVVVFVGGGGGGETIKYDLF